MAIVSPCAEEVPRTKTGDALSAENTVHAILFESDRMDRHLHELDAVLEEQIVGNGVAAAFQRVRRRRQCVQGLGYHLVGRTAIPRMTKWYAHNDTLTVPQDMGFDPYEHDVYGPPPSPDPTLYRDGLSSAYWLGTAAQELLDELEADTRHPFHRLLYHLEETYALYKAAKTARDAVYGTDPRDEPGRAAADPAYTYKSAFIGPLIANVGVGIDALAARSMHFVARAALAGQQMTAEDINRDVVGAFSRARYIPGAHKGTGSRQAEKDGLQPQLASTGFARSLAEQLEHAKTIEELMEPLLQDRTVHDEYGCPAKAIRTGPLAHPGVCHGNINVPVVLDPEPIRLRIYTFVLNLGLRPEMRTDICNMAAITLGMGKAQLQAHYYPKIAEFVQQQS